MKGDDVQIVGDDRATKQTLKQIIQDLVSSEVTLRDLWSKDDKNAYLDRLAKEGFSVHSVTNDSNRKQKASQPSSERRSKKTNFDVRSTLIPKALNFDFATSKPGLAKIWRVWDELQNRLYLNRNPCSIGVMLRCLIWLSTDYYVQKHRITVRAELHLRMKDVADHMGKAGSLDANAIKTIKAFADSEQLISARTTHLFVHSLNTIPNENNLRLMWEAVDVYVCCCLGIS